MRNIIIILIFLLLFPLTASISAPRDDYLGQLEKMAKQFDDSFSGFSVERGKELYFRKSTTGKAETPSCTTCHSDSPLKAGQTRAGKPIDPMAVSKTPSRFTDIEKIEKWFRRNCKSVLGRECTPIEKGDFITFLMSQ